MPWREIVRMRNVLVHAYFGIDLERVWAVVEKDLPELSEQIASALADGENLQEDCIDGTL